jgi:effector-binding domain-containing protein
MKILIKNSLYIMFLISISSFIILKHPSKKPNLIVLNNFQDSTKNLWLEIKKMKLLNLIYTIDTVNNIYDIERKISQRHGDMFMFSAKEALNTSKQIVFYKSRYSPIIFETAVEVDKLPTRKYWDIHTKIINSKLTIVAHYKGSYQNINIAYSAIENWLIKKKTKPNGLPFEVNLNDKQFLTNKDEVVVDVYQPLS